MSICYEWCVETIDAQHDDVEDLHHFDTFVEARTFLREKLAELMHGEVPFKHRYDLCLIRKQYEVDDPGSMIDQQWAYVIDGALEAEFDGGAKVPKKYLNEVAT